MTRKREQNDRPSAKDELKKEVKEYNSKPKAKISLSKNDISSANIELSPKQHELYKTIRNNTITLVQGPAGTAKTFVACYSALCLLADKKIEKIILTKPIQEAGGEVIGLLPGSIQEKTDVYMNSYFSNIERIIGKQSLSFLRSSEDVVVSPIAYMRGATFDDCIMIADEAQNMTMKQLMLWITRMGKNSRAVLMGDISQYDIKKKDSKFLEFIEMIKGVEGVCEFRFEKEDIVRHKILIDIVDKYEEYKSSHDE